MWTAENRPLYDRDKLRYPSDLTDAEWQHIGPLLPPAKRGGGKRTVDMREVVNGLMYVLSTGCQWRYIPKDLPPRSTVHEEVSEPFLDRIKKAKAAAQAIDREAEVHRSIERMMPGAATLQAAIGEAFSSSPTLHWSAVLHEIADGTEVGDIDVAGAS